MATRDELDERDAVPEGDECPTCGNADMDTLGWVVSLDDDDTVECENCGTVYTPGN